MGFSQKNLKGLVKLAIEHNASDIHLRAGETPVLRIRGELVPVQSRAITNNDINDVMELVISNEKTLKNLKNIHELDGGHEIDGVCRLRYNYFRYSDRSGIIFRIINTKIPTIEELGLCPITRKISEQRRGLILVTGETGSGKSTTLAAMINHINNTRPAHIITIEDPIEYLHIQKKARITQREVGSDTENFTTGLRAALRQDPDIILIGEMRDMETISIALRAAETGHTVFSTVHTTNAISTISRIMSLFPPSEQEEVAKRLSESLYATISQRMLRSKTKTGVVVAQEIMVTNPGIKESILGKSDLARIDKIIQDGKYRGGNGSQTFDQHIFELYKYNMIDKEVALANVKSESDFIQKLMLEDDEDQGVEESDDEII